MALDVDSLIGGIDRTIASRDEGGVSAHVLVATCDYDASREELWDALTNPDRIPRWFLPISGDLRVGGRYQFEGNAGGEIVACESPSRLQVTWEMQGQVSWVTVDLTAHSDTLTSLRLEHVAHVPDEFWLQFGPGAVGVGWDMALFGLGQHFATRAAVDPSSAAAWMGSEEGRSFVVKSSAAWCDAFIASGAEPGMARAAADRTTAFYTGG